MGKRRQDEDGWRYLWEKESAWKDHSLLWTAKYYESLGVIIAPNLPVSNVEMLPLYSASPFWIKSVKV